jgi:hypothetical protein
VQQRGGATKSGKRRFKAETIRVAMDHEARNGTGNDDNEEYTNIYFIVGDRRETATYRANQVTDMELKGERELLLPLRRELSARPELFYLLNAARILSVRFQVARCSRNV